LAFIDGEGDDAGWRMRGALVHPIK
jgi:hypothetical protein